MSLSLYSEPYGPLGNIDARAARRALTQPAGLGLYDLLLRETLQNSWDARANDAGPIDFFVDAIEFDEDQLDLLETTVFAELPPESALGDDDLRSVEVALIITDRGTHGLRGSTRADRAQTGEDDFVDFVRNVGRAADKALGGGTFGFGKGVLYDVSLESTVILYSRTSELGEPVSRLMGVRLSDSYAVGGQRFTGRHWWGVPDGATGSEPLTGGAADDLADRLGMDRLTEGQFGTSLMILDPVVFNGENLQQVVERMAEAALFWAWPHSIDGPGGAPTIHFHIEGPLGQVKVEHPLEHAELRDFATAFTRSLEILDNHTDVDDWPWVDREIRALRGPTRSLGALSYRRQLPRHRDDRQAAGDYSTTHTVALMRDPHFVVKYQPAPPDPAQRTVAGVFVAATDLNDQFALAEPVAHDDWVPSNVGTAKYERNAVKQALDKLREALRPDRPDVSTDGSGQATAGLVSLASTLGKVLDGQFGGVDARMLADAGGDSSKSQPAGGKPGAGIDPHLSTAGESDGKARALGRGRTPLSPRLDGPPVLRRHRDGLAAVFPVRLPQRSGPMRLTALPRVVLDGAAEKPGDAPLGALSPAVIGWSSEADGEPTASTTDGLVFEDDVDVVLVWVDQPADTAVTLAVTLDTVEV